MLGQLKEKQHCLLDAAETGTYSARRNVSPTKVTRNHVIGISALR